MRGSQLPREADPSRAELCTGPGGGWLASLGRRCEWRAPGLTTCGLQLPHRQASLDGGTFQKAHAPQFRPVDRLVSADELDCDLVPANRWGNRGGLAVSSAMWGRGHAREVVIERREMVFQPKGPEAGFLPLCTKPSKLPIQ